MYTTGCFCGTRSTGVIFRKCVESVCCQGMDRFSGSVGTAVFWGDASCGWDEEKVLEAVLADLERTGLHQKAEWWLSVVSWWWY